MAIKTILLFSYQVWCGMIKTWCGIMRYVCDMTVGVGKTALAEWYRYDGISIVMTISVSASE